MIPNDTVAANVATSQDQKASRIGIVRKEENTETSWQETFLVKYDNPTVMKIIGRAKLWPQRGSSRKREKAKLSQKRSHVMPKIRIPNPVFMYLLKIFFKKYHLETCLRLLDMLK